MKRPCARWSNIAACAATSTGCCCDRLQVPVPSLICLVEWISVARNRSELVMFSALSVRCSPMNTSWKPSWSARITVSRSSRSVTVGSRCSGCTGIMNMPSFMAPDSILAQCRNPSSPRPCVSTKAPRIPRRSATSTTTPTAASRRSGTCSSAATTCRRAGPGAGASSSWKPGSASASTSWSRCRPGGATRRAASGCISFPSRSIRFPCRTCGRFTRGTRNWRRKRPSCTPAGRCSCPARIGWNSATRC